jgi:divalent metal cation (Fe/Co/Zn/Cd) transporter
LADTAAHIRTVEKASDKIANNLGADGFTELKLRYLEGQIQLELWRSISATEFSESTQAMEETIRDALSKIGDVSRVGFVYRLS